MEGASLPSEPADALPVPFAEMGTSLVRGFSERPASSTSKRYSVSHGWSAPESVLQGFPDVGRYLTAPVQHCRAPDAALRVVARGLLGGEGSELSQSLPEQLSPSSESMFTQASVASSSAAHNEMTN